MFKDEKFPLQEHCNINLTTDADDGKLADNNYFTGDKITYLLKEASKNSPYSFNSSHSYDEELDIPVFEGDLYSSGFEIGTSVTVDFSTTN